ncbi:MAG TPA: aldo/keto reductase [Kofleriaceae bacterium]|nr:aldo/keto reductase [Kofleriaceae bacterium]
MKTALLGKTGVKVSRIALGTMSFGGEADEHAAADIFHRARELGVTFFDTADVYNQGRSEEILGRLIGPCRDQVVLATKGYFPTGADDNASGASRYHLVRAVEASLRRLGTDRIDLYYVHRFDDTADLDETLRCLDDLVSQGKILYPACSNFAAWQVAHALGRCGASGWAPLVAIQPMYNLLKRQAEVEILPMAQALGVAVVPYSPTGGGLLTGKYSGTTPPERGRLVENKMYQARYQSPQTLTTAQGLSTLAAELEQPPATLAVAWVLGHPGVTSVLVGGRSVAQLEPTLAAGALELSGETYARISALAAAPPPATDRTEERTDVHYGVRRAPPR